MTRFFKMTLIPASSLKRLTLALLLAVMVPLTAPKLQAQQSTGQLSERASSDLGKLQPYIDAKNWNGALNLLQGMLTYSQPNSYDQAVAYDIISKVYLQMSDYAASINPLERAYQIGVTNSGFFNQRSQLERLYYLAQLYYQEASTTKNIALRDQYFQKASEYIEIWLRDNPKPTPEGRMFYTSLLYNQAILDPNNVDKVLLKKAQEQVYEGIVSSLNPKESFYVILMATLQQEEKHKESAEVLELLVKQYPSKKSYWQQLMNTYATMAALSKTEEDAYEHNLRSILTIERAQALGHMTSPKDNYNLVGIYFNIKQFDKATGLLYKGLRDGSIESDQRKWELLAYSFQQIHKEFQAIEVLKEASQLFPDSGQLDNQIAQIYYAMDKVPETYRHLNLALAKGDLTAPADVYYFKAYICYELLKYEEALVAIDKSAELGDGSNSRLPQLRSAIASALAERKAVQDKAAKDQEEAAETSE